MGDEVLALGEELDVRMEGLFAVVDVGEVVLEGLDVGELFERVEGAFETFALPGFDFAGFEAKGEFVIRTVWVDFEPEWVLLLGESGDWVYFDFDVDFGETERGLGEMGGVEGFV